MDQCYHKITTIRYIFLKHALYNHFSTRDKIL